nr:MAG TPA: tail completion protein [Caudoviricetes sp.]
MGPERRYDADQEAALYFGPQNDRGREEGLRRPSPGDLQQPHGKHPKGDRQGGERHVTARELQKAIMEDLRGLFATDQFKTPDGKMASPGLYPQFLPQLESDDDTDPFPYIIVRIDSGGIETQTDPHKISIILVIGIFEDSLENKGHESVLEIIERIQRHYEEAPALKEFVCADPFNWALQDEPSYPYFYGAVNLVFHAPAPRAKWSELV